MLFSSCRNRNSLCSNHHAKCTCVAHTITHRHACTHRSPHLKNISSVLHNTLLLVSLVEFMPLPFPHPLPLPLPLVCSPPASVDQTLGHRQWSQAIQLSLEGGTGLKNTMSCDTCSDTQEYMYLDSLWLFLFSVSNSHTEKN